MATRNAAKKYDENVTMEDVRIIFRNFAGKGGQYNKEGDRNFAVLLDHDTAKRMAQDGWNVKTLKPREEGDEEQPYLGVKVNFHGFKPPRVVMITSRGKTTLGEKEVGVLDWADIRNVDLIVRPFEWEVNGKTGVAAYLQAIYVTIEEDELELKYADVDPKTDPEALEFQ
jgi:hypothetical protein